MTKIDGTFAFSKRQMIKEGDLIKLNGKFFDVVCVVGMGFKEKNRGLKLVQRGSSSDLDYFLSSLSDEDIIALEIVVKTTRGEHYHVC